ncbi:MAG: UDP-3-O-(3-hydroxymyristoyl)glucosamine N-acyltransferase [Bacteroidetes bacterium GWF2_33_38]|nr:MAG: UDP-3-O-(3-hydroxymyristoyl)glucosamine N-acyltransferase [Bacteroidetes bacterium GWF2_33_38]OFY91616.1 MAG: UDP-3-O-(3-hydroxymyristoyl)glucosamine N-acyltransferase [Bacteroidetes bacterium RIFOXYA2_FULL_33_7]HBX52578.1 UDP-3-O-(3-hydroxymyristoyl)glucosamine N-acyltransferase [Bacteroidales bacterium]
MKLNPAVTLHELASYIGATYEGNSTMLVTGINEIHRVEKGDLTFVDHPKYYEKALNSEASFILINKTVECPEGKGLIFSNDPFRDYNALTTRFFSFKKSDNRISDSAKIGEGTIIQPGAFVGNDVVIGKNCVIHSNVSIYDNCVIGNDVIIHANTVIGADAFYYKRRADGYDKLKSCGRVVIHNKVEIGANCTIDRGVSSDTIIGEGTKLDNLIQVGHDTVVGKNCLFISQVGVAGCVTVEDDVILWGQVGVQKDLTIGKGAIVLGQSGIGKSIEGNKVYFGSPVQEAKKKMKELALMKRLPDLFKIKE